MPRFPSRSHSLQGVGSPASLSSQFQRPGLTQKWLIYLRGLSAINFLATHIRAVYRSSQMYCSKGPYGTCFRTSFPQLVMVARSSMQVQMNRSDRFKTIPLGSLAALAPLHDRLLTVLSGNNSWRLSCLPILTRRCFCLNCCLCDDQTTILSFTGPTHCP